MKKILILLLLAALFSSCVTEKKCNRKYPPQFVVIQKDSIIYKEKVVVRDSIIKVILPSDTVRIYKHINSKSAINLDTIIVEKGIVGAMAFVNSNKLGVVAYVSDSSIYYKLDSAQVRISKYKEALSSKQETIIKETVINSRFAGFTIWWFFITCGLLLILIYLKIR